MGRFVKATDELMDYLSRVGAREHPAQTRCREETQKMGAVSGMQIAPEQGAFLALMVKLIGATRCLEVGTFTGYSALSVALALPLTGRIVALDVSKEFTDKARVYWREAGVEAKIDLRLGPGVETLDAMISAKRGPVRLRLHRRRQGQLRQLLRTRAEADAAGRPDRCSTTCSGAARSPTPPSPIRTPVRCGR
jgi:hypothetical protein